MPVQAQVLSEVTITQRHAIRTKQLATLPVSLLEPRQFAKKQRDRKKVEILFSHLKRILRLVGSGRAVNAALRFEFTLAAIAQNSIGQGSYSVSSFPGCREFI
jgi:hypothetical protein